MTVSELLTLSKERHLQAQTLRKTKAPEGQGVLCEAAVARQSAHDLDPQHTDPAWSGGDWGWGETKRSHAQMHDGLMTFYREKGAL